jgi:hypothetical protein
VKTLAQIGHNGSTYGELGSDAAKQVLLYAVQVLENKLPAGKYEGGWCTGWCAAPFVEVVHRGSHTKGSWRWVERLWLNRTPTPYRAPTTTLFVLAALHWGASNGIKVLAIGARHHK